MIQAVLGAMAGMGKKASTAINAIAGSSTVQSLKALAGNSEDEKLSLSTELAEAQADADFAAESPYSNPLQIPYLDSTPADETLPTNLKVRKQEFTFKLKEDVMVSMRQKQDNAPLSAFDDFKQSLFNAIPAFVAAKAGFESLKDVVFADREFVIQSGTVFKTDSDRMDELEAKVAYILQHGQTLSSGIDSNNSLLDALIEAQRKETLRRKRKEDEEQVEKRDAPSRSLLDKGLDALKEKAGDVKDDVVGGITGPLKQLANSPLGKGLSFVTEKLGMSGGLSKVGNVARSGLSSVGGVAKNVLARAPAMMGGLGSMAGSAMGALGSAGSALGGVAASAGSALAGAASAGASALGGMAAAAAPALAAAAPFIAAAAGVAAVGYGAYKLGSWLFGKDEEDLEELRADRPVEDPYKPQLSWFSEMMFATNNPDAYEEFKEFREDKIEDIEDYGVVRSDAEWQAKQVAINNFADEIIQAKAGEPSEHYEGDEEYIPPAEKPEDLTKPQDGKIERPSGVSTIDGMTVSPVSDEFKMGTVTRPTPLRGAEIGPQAGITVSSEDYDDDLNIIAPAAPEETPQPTESVSFFDKIKNVAEKALAVTPIGMAMKAGKFAKEKATEFFSEDTEETPEQKTINGFKVGSVERPAPLRGGEIGQPRAGLFMDNTDVADDFFGDAPQPVESVESGGILDKIKSGAGKAFDFVKGGGLLGMGYRALFDDKEEEQKTLNGFKVGTVERPSPLRGREIGPQAGLFMDNTDVADDFGVEETAVQPTETTESGGFFDSMKNMATDVFNRSPLGLLKKGAEFGIEKAGALKDSIINSPHFNSINLDGITDSASGLLDSAQNSIKSLPGISDIGERVSSMIPTGMGASVMSGVSKAKEFVMGGGLLGKMFRSDTVQSGIEKARGGISSAMDFVYDKTGFDIETVPDKLKEMGSSVLFDVTDTADNVMNSGVSSIEGVMGKALDTGRELRRGLGKMMGNEPSDDQIEQAMAYVASANLALSTGGAWSVLDYEQPITAGFEAEVSDEAASAAAALDGTIIQSATSAELAEELKAKAVEALGVKSWSEARKILNRQPKSVVELDTSGADEFDFDAPIPSAEPMSNNVVSIADSVGGSVPNPVADMMGNVKRASNTMQATMNKSVPSEVREMLPNIQEVVPNVKEMVEQIGPSFHILPMPAPKKKGPVPSSAASGEGQNPPSMAMSSAPTFSTKDKFRRNKDFI